MKSELSPEAPVYIPPPLRNVALKSSFSSSKSSPNPKEPQCSRYSRKSVRSSSSANNSPRPILGNKPPFPRPILGRRDDSEVKEINDDVEEYIGKEYRRSFSRMKLEDEADTSFNEENCE